jgi:hypothetical protein
VAGSRVYEQVALGSGRFKQGGGGRVRPEELIEEIYRKKKAGIVLELRKEKEEADRRIRESEAYRKLERQLKELQALAMRTGISLTSACHRVAREDEAEEERGLMESKGIADRIAKLDRAYLLLRLGVGGENRAEQRALIDKFVAEEY